MISQLNYCHSQSVVTFSEIRNDQKEANKIIKANTGLSHLSEIADKLSSGDYIPVLKAVWSEKDKPKRLQWLREQVNDGLHAILCFELAVAEFAAAPTADTLNLIALPLIKAGVFRTKQDEKCINDNSLGDAYYLLEVNYWRSLRNIASRKGQSIEQMMADEEWKKKREDAIFAKMKEIAERSLIISLPSPKWIAYHGLSAFIGDISIKSVDECKQIRDAFAKETIQGVSR